MRRISFALVLACALLAIPGLAQENGPYKVLKVQKVGGDRAFDYVYADVGGRRLYIPRSGEAPRNRGG